MSLCEDIREQFGQLRRPNRQTGIAIAAAKGRAVAAVDFVERDRIIAVVPALHEGPFVVDHDDLLMRRREHADVFVGARRCRNTEHPHVDQFVEQPAFVFAVDVEHQRHLDAAGHRIEHQLPDVRG